MGLLVAGVAASVGIACSNSSPSPLAVEIPQDPVPPKEFESALDAYLISGEADGTVRTARDILIRACAAQAGIQWQVLDRKGWETSDNARRYGITQLADAQILGYHLPKPAMANERSLQARLGEQWTPAQRTVLYGSGPTEKGFGGCWGQANQTLRLDEAEARTNVPVLYANDALNQAKADNRVAASRKAWVSCMKARGYDYADPEAAPGDRTRFNFSDPQPSAAEISTAVADVECRTESRYTVTLYAVDSAFQRELVQKHFQELSDLKELQQEAVRRASDIVAKR